MKASIALIAISCSSVRAVVTEDMAKCLAKRPGLVRPGARCVAQNGTLSSISASVLVAMAVATGGGGAGGGTVRSPIAGTRSVQPTMTKQARTGCVGARLVPT